MKMKTLIMVMAVCLCLSILSGCGGRSGPENTGASAGREAAADGQAADGQAADGKTEDGITAGDKTEAASGLPAGQDAQPDAAAGQGETAETGEGSLVAAAQEAHAGATAGRAASSDGERAGVWNIPVSGMDITLPESWRSSDCYIAYNSNAIQPDLAVTNCVAYAETKEELDEAAQRLGGDSDEFYEYIDERVNDMFIIISASNILSRKNVMELIRQDDPDLSFDLEEIGRTDGWTFYNVIGEDVLRRPVPPEGRNEDIEKFIADLPELFENIRFYEPEGKPSTKAGSAVSFETVDFDGNEIDSSELFAKNRYTMINLWMSWCTYCVEEMPALEEMNKEFAKDGGAVIGVMLDGDMEEELETGKEIRDKTGVTYPLLIPTARMKEQLIATGYPTTIFVDSNGIVVGDPIVGMDPDGYRERMEELLAGDYSGTAAEKEEKEDGD